jgi:hypothetical protein
MYFSNIVLAAAVTSVVRQALCIIQRQPLFTHLNVLFANVSYSFYLFSLQELEQYVPMLFKPV